MALLYCRSKDGSHLGPNQSALIEVSHSKKLQIDMNIVTCGICNTSKRAIYGLEKAIKSTQSFSCVFPILFGSHIGPFLDLLYYLRV